MSHLDTALDQFVSLGGAARDSHTASVSARNDRVRVLVADPDPLARRALTDALREDGAFLVIGQAADATETVELACHYRPELLLLAAHLPNADSIAICERIVRTSAATRIVMLATAADVELEMRAVRAGASGYLVKSDEIESIGPALALVVAGHAIVSPELTAVLVERLRRTPEGGTGTRPVKSSLTDREWEVLDLICGGATTREIAEVLYLSPETVNSHAKSVLKKLGVHSRAAAVEAASMLRGEVLA